MAFLQELKQRGARTSIEDSTGFFLTEFFFLDQADDIEQQFEKQRPQEDIDV